MFNPLTMRSYFTTCAIYELVHKVSVLRKKRVRNSPYSFCPYDETNSRPMLVTEKVIATSVAMTWSPLIAPLHFFDDITHFESTIRGLSYETIGDDVVCGWTTAIWL